MVYWALSHFHGLAVQLDDIPGAALFAPHGTDLTVHLNSTALHQLFGFAAGLTQARIFQQGIQLDKFRMNENFLHKIAFLSRS